MPFILFLLGSGESSTARLFRLYVFSYLDFITISGKAYGSCFIISCLEGFDVSVRVTTGS